VRNRKGKSTNRDWVNFSTRDSSGLDKNVAVLLVRLTVDMVDGVMLNLVRREKRDLSEKNLGLKNKLFVKKMVLHSSFV
jgi:hypothetical protein